MSEKFTIRRLEVGERIDGNTDFALISAHECGMRGKWGNGQLMDKNLAPHYRITAQPAEAKPGEEVDPGKGWRLLKPGEVVEKGDEYFDPFEKQWVASANYVQPDCTQDDDFEYRRRIAPASVESALVVDLREHELGELRKANETLLAENNRHELAWSDCSKKMDEIDRENDDLKRANAELLERCEQLTAAKNYRIELMGLEEVIDERDKLRAELAWLIQRLNAALVLESETNRERDELKAQLATLKATAANEGQEAKWESDWSKLPSERCYGWTWGESYGRHSVWFTDFNYSPEAPGIFKHHVQMPQGHWCSMGGKPKLFCLAKPPAVPVDPPATEPQDDWRELSKGDTYSGPGQVRYGDDQDWEDADIIYIDNVTKSQMYFIACKPAREALFYSQARVREEKGGNQ